MTGMILLKASVEGSKPIKANRAVALHYNRNTIILVDAFVQDFVSISIVV